jgi:hypothetical protein
MYDFSELASSITRAPVQATETEMAYKFCGVADVTPMCTTNKAAFCVYWDNIEFFSVARWQAASDIESVTSTDTGVTLTFQNSEDRVVHEMRLELTVRCADTAGTAQITRRTGTPYTYIMQLDHPSGCKVAGGGGGLSGGSLFLIILLVGAFVYVVGGCLLNWKVRALPLGRDACPNRAFWAEIPGYTKAGCAFTWGKLRGLCGGSKGGAASSEAEGYGSV